MNNKITLVIFTIALLFLFYKFSDLFAASALPDLVVTSVSSPPTNIEAGSKFTVIDTTKNIGQKKAGASVTRYYLSFDQIKDDKDIRLTGKRKVKALKVRKSSKGKIKVTIPVETTSGNYYLIACADDTRKKTEIDEDNNCISTNSTIVVIGVEQSTGIVYTGLKSQANLDENNFDMIMAAAFKGSNNVNQTENLGKSYFLMLLQMLKEFKIFDQIDIKLGGGTFHGDCGTGGSGGSFSLSYDKVNDCFGAFDFDDYCTSGTTYSGEMSLSCHLDTVDSRFDQINFSFESLTISAENKIFKARGKINYSINSSQISTNMNVLFQDVSSKEVFKSEDLKIIINKGDYFNDIEILSGKFYHPKYGYITVSTDIPIRIYKTHEWSDYWPSRGKFIINASGSKKSELDIISCDQYQIRADTIGNGSYNANSGIKNWYTPSNSLNHTPYYCSLLSPVQTILLERDSSSMSVAIGDVNNDGRNDVVVAGEGYSINTNYIYVLLQNLSGGLDSPIKYSTTNERYSYSSAVAIGDINNDGKADVVVGNCKSNIEVFLQNISGGLDSGVTYQTINSCRVKIGDLNNDGLLDILGGGPDNGNIVILLQNDSHNLNAPITYFTGLSGLRKVDTGDLNNDGLTDIVVLNSGGGLIQDFAVLHQNRFKTFNAPVYYDSGAGSFGIAVGDINNDYLEDVVISSKMFTEDDYTIWFIGTFLQGQSGELSPWGYESYLEGSLAIGDINHDNRNDVILIRDGYKSRTSIFLQDTDGTLLPYEEYQTISGFVDPQGGAIGDINGDGYNDIVFVRNSDYLGILYNIY